jgi:hypothetical protein
MKRLRLPFLLLSVFTLPCLTTACSTTNIINESESDDETGATSNDSQASSESGNGSGGPGEGLLCSDEDPCPDGQFCFNGLCALGCTSDDNCAENQYCDTTLLLCQNKDVFTCVDDSECAANQVCLNGLCTTELDTSCDPEQVVTGQDGCASNAVCFEEFEGEPGCYTMPACAEDDTCPVGTEGAVCNVDYINKDRICLVGLCESDSNCPADWDCYRFGNEVLGFCHSGGAGLPCSSPTDCASGVCDQLIPGAPGVCQ